MKRYIKSTSIVWPNGKAVTSDELIDVVMYFYGEDMNSAKEDIKTMSNKDLQRAVNYYAEKDIKAACDVVAADDVKHTSAVSFDFINDGEYDYSELGTFLMNAVDETGVECLGCDFREVDYSGYPEYKDEIVTQGGIDFRWSGDYTGYGMYRQEEHAEMQAGSIEAALGTALAEFGYTLIGIDFYSREG